MADKNLLIHLDDSKACAEAEIEFTGRFDAHLTALYLVPEIVLPVAIEGYIGSGLYTGIEELERRGGETVPDELRQIAEARGVEFDTRVDCSTVAAIP